MTDRHPLLLIIDGHALAFRAFHALKEQGLRASTGEPTYAIFGFTSIMLNAIRDHQPEYVVVTFDIGRTFRDDLYAEYKAGRAETPQEFEQQLSRIKQLLNAFSIPIVEVPGFEADDAIGTLGVQAAAQKVNTLILTGDTDSLQLVNDHVHVLLANPYARGDKNTTYYALDQVVERYNGLQPAQLTDLRGLKGDTSDNIPGVKGIGEAGAISLLKEFGTVEGIYARFSEVPKRYQKPLDGQQEIALFSKKIATIVCDAPVTLDLKAATIHEYDRAQVIKIFQELEMGKTLIQRLPASGNAVETVDLPAAAGAPTLPETPAVPARPAPSGQLDMFAESAAPAPALRALGAYSAVTTPEQLAEVVAALETAGGFAFDTETDTIDAENVNPLRDPIVGFSLAVAPASAWYIPIGHSSGEQLPRETVLAALRPFFADPAKPKYAHNAKFDIEVLAQPSVNVPVKNLAFDTMIAAQLLDKRRSLKELAFYELQLPEQMIEYEEVAGKGKTQISFKDVSIEAATPYAAADADMTLRLVHALTPQLAERGKVGQVFQQIEMPLLPVIVDMERAGITLDAPFMRGVGVRMGERLSQLEQEIYAIAGKSFNINSGDQLGDVLFGKLGIDSKGLERTKTGKISLTAQVLEDLRPKDSSNTGIIDLILQQRQLSKLKSTYVDALPVMVNPDTGRVHTQYSQIGAATGRMASNKPNLQNIPTRTDEGRELRRGFVAAPGHTFVAADYSQIELRVLAHVTQDAALIQAFVEDQDIHAATAAQLFNVPVDKVEKNQRRVAKCVARGTSVVTERGIIPIEQLGAAEPGEVAEIYCEIAQEGSARAVATGFYYGDFQQTRKIMTVRGYSLEATAQHRVRSIDETGQYVWKTLAELVPGDYVALARGTMQFGTDSSFQITYTRRLDRKMALPDQLTPAFAKWLGYFIAEGNFRRGKTSAGAVISNNDSEVLTDLRQLSVEVFGGSPSEYIDRNGVTTLVWNSSRLVELLDWLGVGDGAERKRIPEAVMQGSYESVTAFLRAYFEGDGSISKSFISAASKSHALIGQLKLLLLNLGCVVYEEYQDVPDYGRHYKIRLIGRESRECFARHVGFVSTRKGTRLTELLTRIVTNEPIILPQQRARLTRMYPRTKRELKETIHTCIRTRSSPIELTYRRLATILDRYPDQEDDDYIALKQHQERNVFYDRVKTIDELESDVYDLVVPATNTYVANGFISHNTTVFGVIYGISAFGLAPRIGSSRAEAQALIDALFARFPKIREYIDNTLAECKRDGYVQSMFGRRRSIPEINIKGPRQAAAQREAINAPIQATAADIMKLAMIRVADGLRDAGLKTQVLLQVHDELILEAPDAEVKQAVEVVCAAMEGAIALRVPLKVDVETGPNWLEMSGVESA